MATKNRSRQKSSKQPPKEATKEYRRCRACGCLVCIIGGKTCGLACKKCGEPLVTARVL